MRRSRGHGLVLVLLATIGLSAAGVVWYCFTWTQVLASTDEVAALKIDALVERAARLDAALQIFVRGREGDISWFTSTSALVNDLHARAAELDAALPGVAMAPRARLAEVLQRIRETVDGARANFDAGRTLMALDAMESNGQPATAAVVGTAGASRTVRPKRPPAGGLVAACRRGRGGVGDLLGGRPRLVCPAAAADACLRSRPRAIAEPPRPWPSWKRQPRRAHRRRPSPTWPRCASASGACATPPMCRPC